MESDDDGVSEVNAFVVVVQFSLFDVECYIAEAECDGALGVV